MPKGQGVRDSVGRFRPRYATEEERLFAKKRTLEKFYSNPENILRIKEKRRISREKNKEKNKIYYAKYRLENKEAIQRAKEKYRVNNKIWTNLNERCKRHNISIPSFLGLLETQNYECSICQFKFSHDPSDWNNVHVDHCHETLKVRGLLCDTCNKGLGQFKENSQLLLSAARYLSEFKNTVEGTL